MRARENPTRRIHAGDLEIRRFLSMGTARGGGGKIYSERSKGHLLLVAQRGREVSAVFQGRNNHKADEGGGGSRDGKTAEKKGRSIV